MAGGFFTISATWEAQGAALDVLHTSHQAIWYSGHSISWLFIKSILYSILLCSEHFDSQVLFYLISRGITQSWSWKHKAQFYCFDIEMKVK